MARKPASGAPVPGSLAAPEVLRQPMAALEVSEVRKEIEMSDRDQIGTNAADSAPGVNDGRATGQAPRHFTKPGGRGRVFLWLALSIVLLLVIFIARPLGQGGADEERDAVPPPPSAAPATTEP